MGKVVKFVLPLAQQLFILGNVCMCMLSPVSRVRLFATLWTVACQAALSMGFSRQEYWSGFPRPPAGDHPDPGIEPAAPASPALVGGLFTTEQPGKHRDFQFSAVQ